MERQAMATEQPQKLTWTAILRRAVRHHQPSEFHTAPEYRRDDPSNELDEELCKVWQESLGSEEPEKLQKRLLWADIDASVMAPLICQSRAYGSRQLTSD